MKLKGTSIIMSFVILFIFSGCVTFQDVKMTRYDNFERTSTSTVTLRKETMIATNLDNYKVMFKIAALGDHVRLVKMLGNGQICYIPAGAEVSVVDSVYIFGHTVKEIKVIYVDNYYKDYLQNRTFWVDEHWLR